MGQNILITGVSKGLGLKTVEVLLEKGLNIYGISRTKSPEVELLLEQHQNSFFWQKFDLSNADGIKNLFQSFIGFDKPIHGFVNNAAIAYDDIITNLNYHHLSKMYQINVFSPMMLTKSVIRQMLLHNINGSIVHISSISVHTGYKGLSMYASTKGAIEAFSRNTSREWGEKGIRSNCIVAGFMETEMSSTLSSEKKQRIYQRTSLKKPTTVGSVAEMISFLLSDACESITGQNIHVDSGTI